MIYILTILYSVFLGSIFRNFFSPKYEASTDTTSENVTMQLLIVKSKTPLIVGILILFLIDWISFLFIYEPHSHFSFELQDFILTLFYIPTVTCLTFTLILALDTNKEKYCLFFTLYHIFSTIAELTWIILTVNKLENVNPTSILLIGFGYIILKVIWSVIFYLRHKEQTVLNPTYLTFLSCVFKPALIIFLYYATNFSTLIQQH